jgi:hypothetical protein
VCVAFGEAEGGEDVYLVSTTSQYDEKGGSRGGTDASVHAGDDGQFARYVSLMAVGER